jgi:hypothetical protein
LLLHLSVCLYLYDLFHILLLLLQIVDPWKVCTYVRACLCVCVCVCVCDRIILEGIIGQ